MYPRIPKITVARSNRSVNTSIVVMRSPPFGGNNLFHIPVGAPIISCAPVFVNLPPPGGFSFVPSSFVAIHSRCAFPSRERLIDDVGILRALRNDGRRLWRTREMRERLARNGTKGLSLCPILSTLA